MKEYRNNRKRKDLIHDRDEINMIKGNLDN
jgi:hypothetical protein